MKAEIKIKAKTGGIKVNQDESWYNPDLKLKEKAISELRKGMVIEFEPDSNKIFSSYKILSQNHTENSYKKYDSPNKSDFSEKTKNIWISREHSNNIATQILEIANNYAKDKKIEIGDAAILITDIVLNVSRRLESSIQRPLYTPTQSQSSSDSLQLINCIEEGV